MSYFPLYGDPYPIRIPALVKVLRQKRHQPREIAMDLELFLEYAVMALDVVLAGFVAYGAYLAARSDQFCARVDPRQDVERKAAEFYEGAGALAAAADAFPGGL